MPKSKAPQIRKSNYRGHTIEVSRERCMGGWMMTYIAIVRNCDGFIVEDTPTYAEDPLDKLVEYMKKRIDSEIEDGATFEEGDNMNHPYEIVEVDDDAWAFYTEREKWSMDLLGSYDSKDRCGVWPSYEEADEAAQDYWRGID